MQSANLANRAERNTEVGHVWEEKVTNSQGIIHVQKYTTFRVRAAGATTVTIDGILAATMMANEILVFNAGNGITTTAGEKVDIVIAGANAWVQVARSTDRTV